MGMFKEMMIEAEDALRAVDKLIQTLPELEDEGGFVEEMLAIGDGGFLIIYSTGLGPFYFAAGEGMCARIEVSEYDLAAGSSTEITASVPELMELING